MTKRGKRRRGGFEFTPEPTCDHCGKRGRHYAPASMGEAGYYVCKERKTIDVTKLEDLKCLSSTAMINCEPET